MDPKLRPQILVIRQLALGDTILVTPIVRKLWEDYEGDCDIDVCTLKPEVFKNNPWIRNTLLPNEYVSAPRYYDKTINLDLAYEKFPKTHITRAYQHYAFGPRSSMTLSPRLFTTPADRQAANQFHQGALGGKPFGLIHMRRDTWPSRNLPAAVWQTLASEIVRATGITLVQIGGEHELAFTGDNLIDARARFSIHELKELMELGAFYVGIDSGTLHIAACTQIPIVCMFTSARHEYRQPLRTPSHQFFPIVPNIDCYGCQGDIPPPITGVLCRRGDVECINRFDITQIVRTVQGIL